ncbi:hypothetical protein JW964_09450 [candidate division KSB1 bacterium]|nr:hypothetical protein [candidate division KSB1 bacterium]
MLNRLLFLFLFAPISLIFAQEEAIRYCRFNNLAWLPDGQNLTFECYYIEEGLDKIAPPAILMKNIQTEKIVHLNPVIERFAISADKKYLIFSSRFGLFIMEIARPENCSQIHFLNPSENKYLKSVGFFEVAKGIGLYWKMVDSWGEEIEVQLKQINTFPTRFDSMIYWMNAQQFKSKDYKDATLPVIDPASARIVNHPCRKMNTNFVFKPVGSKTPDLLNLFHSDWNSKNEKKLLEKIRPRLFSYSPDSLRMIVSFWQEKGGEITHCYDIKTRKMQKISNEACKFLSWINNTEFIGLMQSGLYKINLNQIKLRKISQWIVPDRYDTTKKISAFTIADLKSVSKKVENKKWMAKIEDLTGDFIQSQIVLTDKQTGKSKIFMPPISNIKTNN